MALYVKDPEVDSLAREVMQRRKLNKTEAVRLALRNELARDVDKPSLVELTREFQDLVRAMGNPEKGLPIDKAFIDSLYEDDHSNSL